MEQSSSEQIGLLLGVCDDDSHPCGSSRPVVVKTSLVLLRCITYALGAPVATAAGAEVRPASDARLALQTG